MFPIEVNSGIIMVILHNNGIIYIKADKLHGKIARSAFVNIGSAADCIPRNNQEFLEEKMKKIFLTALAVLMALAVVVGCKTDPEPEPVTPSGPYVVTFNSNHTDSGGTNASPPTRIVTPPATTVSALPGTNPTRIGYIFEGWYLVPGCTGAEFTTATIVNEDMTVYAKWRFGIEVVFDKNFGDTEAVPSSKEVSTAGGNVGTLPAEPTREAYKFVQWNRRVDGKGEEFKADTPVDTGITVFAIWEFVGGTPTVVDGALVHPKPLFTVSDEGAVELLENGSIKFGTETSSWAEYQFPEGADEYDYFVIDRSCDGEGRGAWVRKYGGSTPYAPIGLGINQNLNDWLANPAWLVIAVSSIEGPNEGIRITSVSTAATITFNKITFYKAPRYTVSFDWDLPGNALPAVPEITDIMGKTAHINGLGAGAANWPAIQALDSESIEGTDYYFLGWFDGDDAYGPTTPISKNTVLKAKWTTVAPPMVVKVSISHNSNGVYEFELPAGVLFSDVASVSFKALASAEWAGNPHRGHLIQIPMDKTPDSQGLFNIGTLSSWADVAYRPFTGNIFSDIWGAGYALNTWKAFNWVITEKAAGIPPTTTETAIRIGVGFAANNASNTYLIKDVELVLKAETAGLTKIPAVEVTTANLNWAWYHAGAGVGSAVAAKRELVPDVYLDAE